ncbi:MAG: carboxypeptidase-like regulatory domain-containing protein [Bacteroidales bacterium]|nr:carboxypeptidase-like regulatory domain-containing protein [Bacteroidales bacterium]
MTEENAYRNRRFDQNGNSSGFWYALMGLFITLSLSWIQVSAQEEVDFEEISIFLYTRHIGGTEMPAYLHGEVLYLPVANVFSFLKIHNTPTPGYDSVSGFFINQQSPYLIDRLTNTVHFHKNVYKMPPGDLIRTENNLYLKSNYFGEIFGLECAFSYSSMSVTLTTKLELPVIREMRQSMMRSNINKLKGEIKPDTVIKRDYPLFHFGATDWAVSASEIINGKSDIRLNLALGGILAGGEAFVNLNAATNQPVTLRQQTYRWHFANNDFKFFKQILVGKIPVQSTFSVSAPVVGLQVTNTPTTFQRSFCTYTLSDYTEPGWIVELYVNYVLVDYVMADASGYFSFEVPLVYGNSQVKLRFYGPWGEERTREQSIRIPFNFLRPGRFEYTFNAGVVENDQHGNYSKLNLNYGASRRLTLGTGVEYLSTVPDGSVMPFANFSLRLATSLLLTGEYNYGARFKGVLSYRLPADLLIELYYTALNKNQKAINTNFLEERRAVISLPILARSFSSLVRLTLNQIILPGTRYFSSELLLSGAVVGVSTNLTTSALFLDPAKPYIYSNLSLGIKLPAKIIFTPQAQYIYSKNRFLSCKVEFEKRFFRHGTANLLFEKNFISNLSTVQVGIRYDFKSLQSTVSARHSGKALTLVQYARGSMVYEGKGGQLKFSRNSAVGKGGIIVLPFLDVNSNGVFDKGEPKVIGIDLRISGGRVEKKFKDSTIRISELEPFTTYFIELDRTGFENISWKIPNPTISITVNPNQYKHIEVPIRVMGEVSGFLYLNSDTIRKGQGRIYVSIYRRDTSFVARTLTEDDGYFSYLGLPPGEYFAKIDETVLKKINLVVFPDIVPFEIKQTMEGDQAVGIEFDLRLAQTLQNTEQ